MSVVWYFKNNGSNTSEIGLCDNWRKMKTTNNHFEDSCVLW